MNEPKSQPNPFTALGTHLKYLREQLQESLAEVSGAVEIGVDNLERFEQGIERPSEDILLLMISHFGVADKEAGQLWELAGYDQPIAMAQIPMHEFKAGGKQMIMVLALDVRTLYSDQVETTVTDSGVVMNFSQIGGQSQALPVARVGMSIPQAEKVLHSLEQALLKAQYLQGPKQLPASSGNSGNKASYSKTQNRKPPVSKRTKKTEKTDKTDSTSNESDTKQ